MAKRVEQPVYAVAVGHFLDVSHAYLAIGLGRHRSGWHMPCPLQDAAILYSNSRLEVEYVAR